MCHRVFSWAQQCEEAELLFGGELAVQHGLTLTAEQVMHLMVQIIATILYVFTTCALWWFGARPPKQGRS